MNQSSPYNGSLTREQFLFHEMRIAAKLLDEGLSESEVVEEIVNDNLFQFPTERMVKNLACVCVRRLKQLEDDSMYTATLWQGFKKYPKSTYFFPRLMDNYNRRGNYEMAGYTLSSNNKPFNALVFGGEKQSVMNNRSDMFADKNIHMIPVKGDMSHLFLIDRALQQGEIVSMPADRIFGSPKYVKVELLGGFVKLPMGPFSVATMRGLNVVAVNVMKTTANSYKIYVKPLDYDKDAPRKMQIEQIAKGYVTELERMLTLYPTQWYNFFDYWKL